MVVLLYILFIKLTLLTWSIKAQQEYSANSVMACNSSHVSEPSPALLYSFNGHSSSCKAFLIFRARTPFDSVPAIATLLSADQYQVAEINNVTRLSVFPTGREVIVPANCFGSGHYYQANTTYHIPTPHETYFLIANNTFQGLTTCDSLKHANDLSEFRLQPGLELQVPLRCACPTARQVENGTRYLLTYPVSWYEDVNSISHRFGIAAETVIAANSLSEKHPLLYPFTTILLPLQEAPSSSQTTISYDETASAPPPSPRAGGSRLKVNLSVAGGVAAGISVSVVIIIVLLYNKRAGVKNPREAKPVDIFVEIASIDHGLKVYQYSEIKKATGSFSASSRIKGCVYRGSFKGETRAVKRMSTDVSKEVNILNKINHFNLIKLHGFCEHRGFFYLIFDYMENGSLREWLCKKRHENSSSWSQRIQIALDVANGLFYLHHFTKPAYVHKDISSSNILLDGNLRAKIANFRLARAAVNRSSPNAMTSRVVGTKGYMSPEYIADGSVTPKMDVYALGVLLLELGTGKEAVIIQEGEEILLSSAAISAVSEGEDAETRLNYLLEPGLAGNGGVVYAQQLVELSRRCLSKNPANRPSMGEVVSSLRKIQQNLQRGIV